MRYLVGLTGELLKRRVKYVTDIDAFWCHCSFHAELKSVGQNDSQTAYSLFIVDSLKF